MDFFFSKVAGYNLNKKGLHQGTFIWILLNFSKQFFTRVTFAEKFCFFQAFKFYQCFQHAYSFSAVTLRHLPWCSPIKAIIIWLTKQIKIPKVVETFNENFPWWILAFINSQSNIAETGLQHWHFSWKVSYFKKTQHAEYTELSSSDLETLS